MICIVAMDIDAVVSGSFGMRVEAYLSQGFHYAKASVLVFSLGKDVHVDMVVANKQHHGSHRLAATG